MRRDIQVNTSISDMVLKNQNRHSTYPFEWVSEGDLWINSQITIPSTLDTDKLQVDGVKVEIPYTPIYKPFKVRIVRQYDNKTFVPVVNPVDGSEWFAVHTKLWKQKECVLKASQLVMVNADTYILQLNYDKGLAYIWSSNDSDVVNVAANIQNRNLMLQCIPTNNYRYPTSGVGLVRFLHANLSQTNLGTILQKEFEADKVAVKSASFNSFTGDIDMDLDFSEADASV